MVAKYGFTSIKFKAGVLEPEQGARRAKQAGMRIYTIALGTPMDLNFSRFEAASIGLAVLATAIIALDGETHWLEGAFLIAVYLVLAIGFYFVGS